MNKFCLICKRPLDDPRDSLSLDCGGDCLGCVNEIGYDIPDPRPAMPVSTQAEFEWRARFRPANYIELPPAEQWALDRKLGILDWKV